MAQRLKHYDSKTLIYISFAVATIIKLILMGLCSSDYESMMFMPFIKCFAEGNNPYEYYYANDLLASFPYPPLMLLIESIFGTAAVGISNVFLSRLVFKLPLLIFDFIGLYYLSKIVKGRMKYLFFLYFASPILVFATYMHGQIDIIPTALLVAALYYLLDDFKDRNIYISAIVLGMSLATKMHILAVVPVILLYIYKNRGLARAIIYTVISMAVFVAFVLPFLGPGIINTVFINKEQSLITEVFLDYGTVRLLLVIVIIAVLYLKVIQLTHLNKDLVLALIGVIFAVFLAFVAPMPGWFIWIVPFLYIYFISVDDNKYQMLWIYAIFNAVYLVYFILCHNMGFTNLYIANASMDFIRVDSEAVSNIVFSLMTATLLVMVYNMYLYGLAQNSLFKRNNTPFTIGIAGDSGTGKSEFLSKIEDTLGAGRILNIEGDGDHRWERGSSDWEQYTHLDPRANYLYRQAEDIATLRAGNMVRRVDYDHDTGKFTEAKKIKPKPYIVLCGLHTLFLPKSREALDLKIYMDTDETLRRFWKIQRDTTVRGYSSDKIIEQIEKRIPDAKKYIYPQKEYADLVVTYFDKTLTDCRDLSHVEEISLKLTMSIAVDMEHVIEKIKAAGIGISQDFSQDLTRQIIIIDGKTLIGKELDYSELAEDILGSYVELFKNNITYRTGVDGVLQVIILAMIVSIMKEF